MEELADIIKKWLSKRGYKDSCSGRGMQLYYYEQSKNSNFIIVYDGLHRHFIEITLGPKKRSIQDKNIFDSAVFGGSHPFVHKYIGVENFTDFLGYSKENLKTIKAGR